MIWNHLLHLGIGASVSSLFTWTTSGILAAILITAVVQGIDMFRIRRTILAMTMANPEPTRSEQLQAIRESGTAKLVQLYILKVVWYTFITLTAAQFARSFA
jgi:hypothetical protein